MNVRVVTFFLRPPLELEHHVVVSDEGVDGTVEVQRAPQQQAVLPPQLRNHHGDQTVTEGLQTGNGEEASASAL